MNSKVILAKFHVMIHLYIKVNTVHSQAIFIYFIIYPLTKEDI